MSTQQDLADWFSIQKQSSAGLAPGAPPPVNQNPYFTKQNLTFSGVTVGAGAILNFTAGDAGTLRLIVSAIIACVFGGFLIYLSNIDANRETGPGAAQTRWFLGIVNTALLWISLYGVSSINN